MSEKETRSERRLALAWIRATTIGWFVGFVLVVVLALVWESVGGAAQFMVGVGMGAGVGFVQSRQARAWLPSPRRWLWASVAGLGVPFVLWDLGALGGLDDALSLPACAVVGSVLAGAVQARLMRAGPGASAAWVAASVVGWGVPVGLMALRSTGAPPVLAAAGTMVGMFGGGLILGAVTGAVLPRVLPHH